ncbi:MAG TPA: hypothetical protein VIF62_29285 [Labilithrix sp.]
MKRVLALARPRVAALLALAACGSKDPKTPVGTDDGRAALAARKAAATAPVQGYLVASVGERTIGPYYARRADGSAALAAWVTASEGQGRRVVGIPLTGGGEPRGPEQTIAVVPLDTTMLVVRQMRGRAPGFVVAWTSLTDRGEALWAVAVGDDGVPRAKGIELARTNDDIVWADVVPTDFGAVCVWAEETRGGGANVDAAGLDTDGKLRGLPARVANDVTAWHALEAPGGLAVTTVGKNGLAMQKVDPVGNANGQPVVITTKPVSGDVDVVRQGARLVFAWTDRTADEPFVAAAAIDERGQVEPTKKLVAARGGASLVGLASGGAGVAALWQAPARASESRNVHLARIGNALALEGTVASIEAIGRGAPEMAATATGFAVLASARDCAPNTPACGDAAVLPTVFRTDDRVAIVQREPLGFNGDPASMAWGLTCGESCFALAASGASPARVRAAAITPRVNVAVDPPGPTVTPKDAPRVTDVSAVATGESVVDIASAKVGDVAMVAMLANKPETKANDKPTLVLTTRTIDASGEVSSPQLVTSRALAVGGVAIAPAEKAEDGAAVVWVARENGDPEVHVTRVDRKGRRTNDMQLTTTKGDASDVAIAWAGGGWIVAWVDGRDGNGEVYATKVDLGLARIAREERLTNAPGDASDLVALGKGELVWLAWADPRESPKDGMADVFVTAVKKHDAKRAVDETRVLATAAHSRTPHLALAPDGVHVAWIEEAPMGAASNEQSGYGAMWATLDAQGKLAGKPVKLPLGGEGTATAIAIESTPAGVRGVLARATTDTLALDAVLLASTPRAAPLVTLDGPPSLDVALDLESGVLFFNDDGPTAESKRARRAVIDWSPFAR